MAQDKIVTKQRYRSELEMALRMVSKTIDDLKTYDTCSRDIECCSAAIKNLRNSFASLYLAMPDFQIVSNMKHLYSHLSSQERLNYALSHEGLTEIYIFFQALYKHISDEIASIPCT